MTCKPGLATEELFSVCQSAEDAGVEATSSSSHRV
jgi:hypothetical protein